LTTISVLILGATTNTEPRQVYKQQTEFPTTSQPWEWGQRWSSKCWFVHHSTTRPSR